MLKDDLGQISNKLKKYKKAVDSIDQKKEENEKITKFKEAASAYNLSIGKMYEAYSNTSFKPGDMQKLNDAVVQSELLRKAAENDELSFDIIDRSKSVFKKLDDMLKNSWAAYYSSVGLPAKTQINLLSGLSTNKEQYLRIEAAINKAKEWDGLAQTENGKSRIENFSNGLKEIDQFQSSLNLNTEVTTFLRTVANGKADIQDLTDNIIKWIDENDIGNMFSITFKNTL